MNSPLAYIGGKSKLSSAIIGMMPKHKAYCEVFAGAAWVFFRKEPSKYEGINDLDSDLVAFYRVLQNHFEEFLRQFRWLLSSREWFEDWKRQQEAGGLTDIQRAARYYYLQRLCFGGRVKGRTYGAGPMHPPRINLLRMEEELSMVHLRLAGVTIEHLLWDTFINRYDRPETFFLLRSAGNAQNMDKKKYEIVWRIRYCFPIIFIVLFAMTVYLQNWSIFNLNRIDYTEIVVFVGELFVLIFAFYFLSVRYEINSHHIVVHRFVIFRKAYDIKEVQWIEEDGIYSFLGQIPLGIDLTVLNFPNGKRIRILGLKEPVKFIQDIRARQSMQNI